MSKIRQPSAASTLTELMTWVLTSKRVSYRRHGLNGEHRRPMIHRFEVKGGETLQAALAENIARSNPLLRRLMSK